MGSGRVNSRVASIGLEHLGMPGTCITVKIDGGTDDLIGQPISDELISKIRHRVHFHIEARTPAEVGIPTDEVQDVLDEGMRALCRNIGLSEELI